MIILKSWNELESFDYRVCEIAECENKFYSVSRVDRLFVDVCGNHIVVDPSLMPE